MSENFNDLCEQYLGALNSEIDIERLDELEEEIAELEKERAKFVEDYGEDDVLVERVGNEIDELVSEKEGIEGAVDQVDELETKILETVSSGFIAENSYITERTLEALNHIFTGAQESELLIEDWAVTPDVELDSNVRTVTDYIRKLALAKLGTDDSLQKTWSGIEGGKRFDPFLMVARADTPMSPSVVAERIGDDMERQTAGNRLRDAIHHADYSPYHRVDGDYTLSTVGEFMFREFYDRETNEEADGEGESTPNGQATLEATGETNE
ncbi:hypothetical protein BRD03_10750 [Halobacteriales archaeon QS_9_68_17]|nr:MAG: hypothetical protein BRD03_10750 [Halobacteriales archaeon QS_9_68_17]